MKKLILAALMTAALAVPAFANQCPAIMAKIDEAMKTATVDDATKAKITELSARGKTEHDAGDHAASVATLNEAMALLGM